MNKPSENIIEIFAADPESFSAEEKRHILNWISRDKQLAATYVWYRDFYKNVKELSAEGKNVDDIPFQIDLKSASQRKEKETVFVLAADTASVESRAKRTVKVFISEQHGTIIRVVHDRHKHTLCLYAISGHIHSNDTIILRFGQSDDLFVSKPGGKFEISDYLVSVDEIRTWQNCKLFIPVSKLYLYKDQLEKSVSYSLTDHHNLLHVKIDRDEIELTVLPLKSGDIPNKMVLYTDGQSYIWPVSNGKVRFFVDDLKSTESRVFIYA